MHLFFGMPVQKNFANLPSILLTLVNLVLLRFVIYPHHNFTPSLKLTYSTNHFLISLFHALTSLLRWLFDLASGLPSHIHFRCIIHNHFIPLLYGLLMFTVSGNKPPSIYVYGWLLQALQVSSLIPPYNFSSCIFCHCIYHSSHYHVRQLLLLLLAVKNHGTIFHMTGILCLRLPRNSRIV